VNIALLSTKKQQKGSVESHLVDNFKCVETYHKSGLSLSRSWESILFLCVLAQVVSFTIEGAPLSSIFSSTLVSQISRIFLAFEFLVQLLQFLCLSGTSLA
jgi:hypothetical protein